MKMLSSPCQSWDCGIRTRWRSHVDRQTASSCIMNCPSFRHDDWFRCTMLMRPQSAPVFRRDANFVQTTRPSRARREVRMVLRTRQAARRSLESDDGKFRVIATVLLRILVRCLHAEKQSRRRIKVAALRLPGSARGSRVGARRNNALIRDSRRPRRIPARSRHSVLQSHSASAPDLYRPIHRQTASPQFAIQRALALATSTSNDPSRNAHLAFRSRNRIV